MALKIIARSTVKQWASQMTKSGYEKQKKNVLRRCLKTLNIASDGAYTVGHVWWKTAQEVGARNWKTPCADGEVIEWRYTGSWFQLKEAEDGTSSATRVKRDDKYGALQFTAAYSLCQYGDLKEVAFLDVKSVEADERVNDVLGAPNPENEPCCRILHRRIKLAGNPANTLLQ